MSRRENLKSWIAGDYNSRREFNAFLDNCMLVDEVVGPDEWPHSHVIGDILGLNAALNAKLDANAAFSGNYNDLSNKPSIPAAQVNADWLAASGISAILNKPSIPSAQIQSDWTQTNASSADFVKNKPVKTFSAPARALNAAFQPSVSNDAFVSYILPITTSATLLVGARGRLTLQYADDAGMTTNVVTPDSDEFGIASGLVVTGFDVLRVSTIIPKGKYVRLSTTNVLGTPTYGSLSAREVTL